MPRGRPDAACQRYLRIGGRPWVVRNRRLRTYSLRDTRSSSSKRSTSSTRVPSRAMRCVVPTPRGPMTSSPRCSWSRGGVWMTSQSSRAHGCSAWPGGYSPTSGAVFPARVRRSVGWSPQPGLGEDPAEAAALADRPLREALANLSEADRARPPADRLGGPQPSRCSSCARRTGGDIQRAPLSRKATPGTSARERSRRRVPRKRDWRPREHRRADRPPEAGEPRPVRPAGAADRAAPGAAGHDGAQLPGRRPGDAHEARGEVGAVHAGGRRITAACTAVAAVALAAFAILGSSGGGTPNVLADAYRALSPGSGVLHMVEVTEQSVAGKTTTTHEELWTAQNPRRLRLGHNPSRTARPTNRPSPRARSKARRWSSTEPNVILQDPRGSPHARTDTDHPAP